MHTTLIILTSLSIAVVVALSVVIARLLREDHQRSDARVAALAMMAADAAPYSEPEPEPVPVRRNRAQRAAPPNRISEQRSPEQFSDFDLRPAEPSVTPGLFAQPDAESPWGRRIAVIGTLSAVIAAVLLAATFGGRHHAARPPAGPAPAVQTSNIAPLELMELHHARDAQGLTISGVVRNPAGGTAQSHLVATAIVFGAD